VVDWWFGGDEGEILRHLMEVKQGIRRLGVGACSMAQERDFGGAMGERGSIGKHSG